MRNYFLLLCRLLPTRLLFQMYFVSRIFTIGYPFFVFPFDPTFFCCSAFVCILTLLFFRPFHIRSFRQQLYFAYFGTNRPIWHPQPNHIGFYASRSLYSVLPHLSHYFSVCCVYGLFWHALVCFVPLIDIPSKSDVLLRFYMRPLTDIATGSGIVYTTDVLHPLCIVEFASSFVGFDELNVFAFSFTLTPRPSSPLLYKIFLFAALIRSIVPVLV